MGDLRRKVARGVLWVSLEKFSAQLVYFVVAMVLSRLLTPTDYGTIGLLAIFLAVAGSLANCGFGNALVQKKDAGDLEFNSVFYLSLAASGVLYCAFFFAAPWIARFYDIPVLKPIARIAALQIVFSAVNSVQSAELSRKMLFHLRFRVTLFVSIVSAVAGITLAFCGYGVWALVWSSFLSGVAGTLASWTVIAWRPRWMFSFRAAKGLFSYGWKMSASGLVHTAYSNLYGFLIGRIYTPADLAYVNKGRSLPNLAMQMVEESILNVSFPALAKLQDHRDKVREAMRRMIQTSAFLVFPLLAGLAACARPSLRLLYGGQWEPSTPFVILACFTFSLLPVNAINTMAISAIGRSDIYLLLEIVKKGAGLAVMMLSIRHGVFAFMLTMAIVASPFSVLVNMVANGRLLGYTPGMQVRDLAPSALLAVMLYGVTRITCLGVVAVLPSSVAPVFSSAAQIAAAIPAGAGFFIALTLLFRPRPLLDCASMVLPVLHRRAPRFAGQIGHWLELPNPKESDAT